jgi:hypothetical protein
MARKEFSVQVAANRAADVLPREIQIDSSTLEMFPGGRTKHGEAKYRARWSDGRLSGTGLVEVRPASKATSMLTVSLEPPTRLGRIFGSKVLSRLSGQFGLALQYEMETRSDEETDAFTSRRTTAGLVRQRSA